MRCVLVVVNGNLQQLRPQQQCSPTNRQINHLRDKRGIKNNLSQILQQHQTGPTKRKNYTVFAGLLHVHVNESSIINFISFPEHRMMKLSFT